MFPLVLTATLAPAQPDTAEQLLRRADDRIAAAKTLRLEFEVRVPPDFVKDGVRGAPVRMLAGSLVVGERNRFRGVLSAGDVPDVLLAVGDGKMLHEVGPATQPPRSRPLPAWYTEVLRSWLGRGGTAVTLSALDTRLRDPAARRPGPDDGPRTDEVRLLPDEEVNGVRCRVVGYVLSWSGDGDLRGVRVRARVWIDPRTDLPVRREMVLPGREGRPWTATATHTRFEIDPDLPDALFAPPAGADLLLARMDAKVRGARALRVDLTLETRPAVWPPGPPFASGSFVLADRNRFRHRFEWPRFNGGTAVWWAVGDGTRTAGGADDPLLAPYPTGPLPPWHNEVFRRWVGLGGPLLTAATMPAYLRPAARREPASWPEPVAANARLLPDEVVRGVTTRVVSYDLIWGGVGQTGPPRGVRVRVWIDPRTDLPVRRWMSAGEGAAGAAYTATFTRFELDPKIDDALFVVPR